MVLEKVISIIADVLSVDPDKITEETNLIEDLEADSLNGVEVMLELEDEFDVEFEDLDMEEFATVGKIVDLIERS